MICYNCFEENPGEGVCPNCGFDAASAGGRSPMALRAGAILNGRFVIGRVLGQGGFGVTYVALDDKTKTRVAIKEYFPAEFASRAAGACTVAPYPEKEDAFLFGKTKFREEAQALSAFRDNGHVTRVLGYFEENGTAYFTMEFVEGEPLDKYVKSCGGRLFREEADELLYPLMEALEQLHAKGLIHRDVAPENILVQPDGSARLVDFAAARYATAEKCKDLDVVISHGFAPYEQYTSSSRQGPFTDVYAMAATYYFTVTGRVPPDAMERSIADELALPRELGAKLPENTEAALMRALSVRAEDRFHTMGEFRDAMAGKAPAAPARQRKEAARPVRQAPAPARERREAHPAKGKAAPAASQGSRLLPAIIIAGAILISAVILAVVLHNRTVPNAEPGPAPIPTTEATAVPETAPPVETAPTSEPNAALPTIDPSTLVTPEPGEGPSEPGTGPSDQPSLPGVEITPEPEPTPEPEEEIAGTPGLDDMDKCDPRIAKPSPSNWLPAYAVRYVDLMYDRDAYLHADPRKEKGGERLEKIREAEKVVLLAVENGFGLIKKDDKCIGWIKLEYLVSEYTNANHA